MDRREFSKVMGAVAAGLVAGSRVFADPPASPAAAKKDTHVCKGLNSCKGKGADAKNDCKGKGSCASAEAQHKCAGQNSCKGLGGCKTAENKAGAGKNSCKGKGGCEVPLKEGHGPAATKDGKSSCKGKGGCKGL